MKNLFMYIFVGILIYSCQKDTLINTITSDPPSTVDENFLFAYIENFNEEFAEFKNQSDYLKFLKEYSKLDQTKQIELIKKLKFSTVSQRMDKINELFNSYNDRNQFVNLIDENQDLLSLVLDDLGEEYVEYNVPLFEVVDFLNESRIIKIDDHYIKYGIDYYSVSKQKENLYKNDLFHDSEIKNFSYLGNELNEVVQRNDFQTVLQWEFTYNPKWCNSDRRIKAQYGYWLPSVVIGGINGLPQVVNSSIGATIKLESYRKGYPCIWYQYSTEIKLKNGHMRFIEGFTNTIQDWFPQDKTVNSSQLITSYQDGPEVVRCIDSNCLTPSATTLQIQFEATHRGLNGIWLTINQ